MAMGLMGGIGLLTCAVLLWRVVDGAAAGTLARDGNIGIRTRATNASDAAWLAGHRAAAAPARGVALVCGVLAVAMILAALTHRSTDPDALVVSLFITGYAAMIAGSVIVARAANRGARSIDE